MRAAVILTLLAFSAHAATTVPVKTYTGLLTGVVADGLESFKGIPYAAPPVGALRWRAPQLPAQWNGVRTADTYGAPCMQAESEFVKEFIPRATQSEDCLTLNIFRSVGGRKLPVMVWIHGGGLTVGTSALPAFDATAFAQGGVILVTFNYRLGRLGFFVHPALVKENADGGRLGNYGLMDQIAALQWVKRNIAAFGGDPANVTIFGESAGGLSVDALMTSPPARGLFHRAIAQSGCGRAPHIRITETAPNGWPSGEAEGMTLAKQWGLESADLAALRALPAATIVDKSSADFQVCTFYLDGKTIDAELWTAFRTGKEAPVPLMIGSTGLEWEDDWNADGTIRKFLTAQEEEQLASTYGPRPGRQAELASDIMFTEQARALARMHSKNGHPVYLYLFDVVPTVDAAASQHAHHAADLWFVFEALRNRVPPISGDAEIQIAKTINGHWRQFATSGDPNAPGLPNWPRYDGQTIMEYTLTGTRAHPDVRAPRLDALSRLIDPGS